MNVHVCWRYDACSCFLPQKAPCQCAPSRPFASPRPQVCIDPGRLRDLRYSEPYDLGIDLELLHYLLPLGLIVLDTRCYAVQLQWGAGGGPEAPVLLPRKLLRLHGPAHGRTLDLLEIAQRAADHAAEQGRAMPPREAIHRILQQLQAQMTGALDHTMETIAQVWALVRVCERERDAVQTDYTIWGRTDQI